MAQRGLSHSWVSPLPEISATGLLSQGSHHCNHFSSENMSCTTEIGSALQFYSNNTDLQQQASSASYSGSDIPSYKQPISPGVCKPSGMFPFSHEETPNSIVFSGATKSGVDVANTLFNPALIGNGSNSASETIDFEGHDQKFSGFSMSVAHEMQVNMGMGGEDEEAGLKKDQGHVAQVNNQCGVIRSIGFPFSLPPNDAWKPTLPWDSPPCPSEMSTSYSTNKCHT